MPFTEDLSVYFNTTLGFASAATLQGGTTGAVPVIFDRAYLEQLGMAGTKPVALAKASDVAATDVGKTLTIGSTAWTIKGYEPQDDGALVLLALQS